MAWVFISTILFGILLGVMLQYNPAKEIEKNMVESTARGSGQSASIGLNGASTNNSNTGL